MKLLRTTALTAALMTAAVPSLTTPANAWVWGHGGWGWGGVGLGLAGRSFNWWRNRGVILRPRLRLRLPRLRLWLRIRPGLYDLRLWLPGLWLWLWDRLLRRLKNRLSPNPPPYLRLSSCPASLALLTEPLNFVRWSSLLLAPATGLLFSSYNKAS